MRRLCLFFVSLLLLGLNPLLSQNVQITGTVASSENGEPIIGASVIVKGTTIGAATDVDGKYSISIPQNSNTLIFSSIGYKNQEVSIEKRAIIDVILDPATQELDEVMVVAYGTVKKSSYTGSASVVESKSIEKINTLSVNQALMGSTPGLQINTSSGQPGAQSTVRIRGTGSLKASSSPLYVIDGIPIKTGNMSDVANDMAFGTSSDVLSSINPNDIESITVLKDASAASLYGSAAANGVIIITTKKGKAGKSNISFSAKYGVSSLPKMRYKLMNSKQIYGFYFNTYLQDELESDPNNVDNAVENANQLTIQALTHNPYNVSQPLNANGNPVNGAKIVVNTDWIDAVYRTAITKDYTLQASGGTDNLTYYLSGAYSDFEGITVGQDFERYSAKFNLSSKINKYLTIGTENTLSRTTQNTPPGATGGASPMRMAMLFSNAIPIYEVDANGKPILTNGKKSYNWHNPVSLDFNPLGLNELDIYKTTTNRVISSFWGEISLLKDLKLKSTFNADFLNMGEFIYYNPYHGDGQPVAGRGRKYAKSDLGWVSSTTLTYNKQLGEHNFSGLLGFEAYSDKFEYAHSEATGYPNLGDVALPELDNASKASSASSYYTESSKLSAFGQIMYNYKNRYYLQTSIRRDGSSKFGSEKRFGTFYAIGASWRVSDEAFLSSIKNLNNLTLKASFGTSGNDDIDNYAYLGLYASQPYNDLPGFIHSQLPNKSIHWEENRNLNIGFDLRLFNRINIAYEYYNRLSYNLLYEKPLPLSTGFPSIMSNLADMKNSGHEFLVNATVLAAKNFQWNINANASLNKNELISITQGKQIEGTKIWEEGGSIYEFYLEEWAGVSADGKPMWYTLDNNGNKVTTSNYSQAVRFKQGVSTPKLFGTVGTSMTYKNFELSIDFYYSMGGKIYDGVEAELLNDGSKKGYQMLTDMLDCWTPTNASAKLPRFTINSSDKSYSRSTLFLHDATYVKLRSLNLSYTLPEEFIRKVGINSAKVYVSGNNLFTWVKDKNLKSWDPEMDLNGIDFMRTPNPRVFSIGLNISL